MALLTVGASDLGPAPQWSSSRLPLPLRDPCKCQEHAVSPVPASTGDLAAIPGVPRWSSLSLSLPVQPVSQLPPQWTAPVFQLIHVVLSTQVVP